MFIKVPDSCIPLMRSTNIIPRPPTIIRYVFAGSSVYAVARIMGNYYTTGAFTNRRGCSHSAFKGYMFEVREWKLPE